MTTPTPPNHEDNPQDAPEDIPTMSTKKPLAAAKAASMKPTITTATKVVIPPLKKIALYHINMHDVAIVAYHSDRGVNYTNHLVTQFLLPVTLLLSFV